MRILLLLVLLFSFTVKAEGFCDIGVVDTIKQAYPKAGENIGDKIKFNDKEAKIASLDINHSQCKVWPAFPELAIIAVSVEAERHAETDFYDLELFIVSLKDNKIIEHYIDKDLRKRRSSISIKLDTAYYKLNDSNIAFAVRTTISSLPTSRSVFKSSEEFFNLYTFQDNKIKKVMTNLRMKIFFGERKNKTTCAGRFEDDKRILIIDKKKSSGFYDLKVKRKVRKFYRVAKQNNECSDTDGKTYNYGASYIKFDGQKYKIPSSLEPIM
jgi:hypothetical protein